MVKLEKVSSPDFSSQLENKVLYSKHDHDISISYESTYTLKYVLEGSKSYTFDNREIEVSKNQYLFINQGKNIHTEAIKGTKGLSFFISQQLVKDIYSNLYGNDELQEEFLELSQVRPNDFLKNWLMKFSNSFNEDAITDNHQTEDQLIQVAELIIKEQASILKDFKALEIVKYNTQRELYKAVRQTKEYINQNFESRITLDRISQNVGVSKYHLHRLFTEITRETPLQYLTKVRLKRAKKAILGNRKPLDEIASECGFESAAYFSRTFKKHIGISPSKYRNPL